MRNTILKIKNSLQLNSHPAKIRRAQHCVQEFWPHYTPRNLVGVQVKIENILETNRNRCQSYLIYPLLQKKGTIRLVRISTICREVLTINKFTTRINPLSLCTNIVYWNDKTCLKRNKMKFYTN